MGKKAQVKRSKKEQIERAKKEYIDKVYLSRNPWLLFWTKPSFWIYAACVLAIIVFPIVPKNYMKNTNDTTTSSTLNLAESAVMHTSKGDITLKFYPADAPKTVSNFVKLSKSGFYNGLTFHRVIKDFMIQGGDPKGDGTGGPGYQFADEINSHKIVVGSLAMANSGPNTNGSQFFIVTEKDQPSLDGHYTSFGEVTSGMDVVRAIAAVPTDSNDKPKEPVYINTIDIK